MDDRVDLVVDFNVGIKKTVVHPATRLTDCGQELTVGPKIILAEDHSLGTVQQRVGLKTCPAEHHDKSLVVVEQHPAVV